MLGLQYHHLSKMPLNSLHEDLVRSWLGREDRVEETSGKPTWASLIKALKEVDLHDVASKIHT